ncbi:MAG: hypothetical protein IKW86_10055 [Salinivirgaceae bacterium]|nr:hypothetical protein [Salinivirgaceae bacterium]
MLNTNPIAEVFGYPMSNGTEDAKYYRENRLCPFHNRFPNCTKDKADDPLGVCSVNHGNDMVITCPSRFREDWKILYNAASFVWPKGTKWTSLPEIKLVDGTGQSAGNIDYVIVSYNDEGHIIDFASIEVQGVYISGNLRNPFNQYMKNPSINFEWNGKNFPHPDYLSSSRKRLIPQMLYKGGIFKAWNKKQCVVIQKSFFDTLPNLPKTTKEKADIAWFLYDLKYDNADKKNHLVLIDTVYTEFQAALEQVIFTKPGKMSDFVSLLQGKLDERISNEPDTHSVYELL